MNQSTESPIFDAHFGQKTGFRARMNEIKSGIQCSGVNSAHAHSRSGRATDFGKGSSFLLVSIVTWVQKAEENVSDWPKSSTHT